ncbi:MAG: D-alanine--D-alanine ligase [Actinomycetota bacterium]|nr:D-alanine--D-alanine ligase [Actinomycetota bacterium]
MLDVKPCVPEETKVLLLVGGKSNERDISLKSGEGVAEGLRASGFPVTVVDTAVEGALGRIEGSDCDVIFICLHGKGGEDGTVQGLCELLEKPYVGPGVLASALAMDKERAKVLYGANGLSTPESIVLRRDEAHDLTAVIAAVGEKCVVKPTTEGSAIGVSIVHDPGELEDALQDAFAIDESVLVERYIEGTEVTVAVLGNGKPFALPVIEIVPGNEFYDFEAKYAEGGSQHICPAHIPDETAEACKRTAILAHEALGCRGVSRSDLIVDASGTPWILETNTIPGMTSTSLLPDAARAVGIGFPELCRLMVELALEPR